MPIIAKKILIVVGAVVIVLSIALLMVNLYLQSEGVQHRIRQAVASGLGAPIQIRSTSYTPWGGLVIGGIEVPDPEKKDLNILEAEALRVRFGFFPLFQGRLLVKQVTLRNPTVVARQRPDRSWVVLVPPPPVSEIPLPLPDEDAKPAGAPGVPRRSIKVEVDEIRVENATISFSDRKGRPVVRAENGTFIARVAGDKTSAGTFEIGRLQIGTGLRPRSIGGPFKWDGKVLSLPSITGTLAGGEILGSYRLETGAASAFQGKLEVRGVKLKKLAEEAGGDRESTGGSLNGQVLLMGNPLDMAAVTGNGTLDLTAARIKPLDFLVQVGQMLGVEELQMLNLSEATSRFTVSDGKVHVDTIFLKSENLILTGKGTADFDGELDLDGALLVNKKLQRQLKAVVGKNFVQAEDPEYKQLDFRVTNTVSNPRTDLLDKLVGMKVGQDVGNLLKNLFRAPKPKDEEKKADN